MKKTLTIALLSSLLWSNEQMLDENLTELQVTEKGIKLIRKNQLINTSIRNSAIAYSYRIEKQSFEGSDFILYKETYLNSSKEQCLIPIYKTNSTYNLTKAYCLDFVISYNEHKRIPMFYIYDLHNLNLRNFKDELSNHPYMKKSIFNKEKNELIFPRLIAYSPYYNELFKISKTCIVTGSNYQDSDIETLRCREIIGSDLSVIEKSLKEKKELQIYNKEFFEKLLPEKPIEKKTLTIYNNIAHYLQKANANEEAVYLLKKILEKFPNRTVAHYNLADAYWALGKKKKAIASYTTYIEQMKANGKGKKIPEVVLERLK